tara:strand:- start:1302 stop:2168 length:867 start_codon:yes stop_codon:yes gene_type:complete
MSKTQPRGGGRVIPVRPLQQPNGRQWNWKVAQARPVPSKPIDIFNRPSNAGFKIGRISGGWPTVHISAIAHQKMWALVQHCPIEIGWLCTVVRQENGDFLVEDVYVPEQECTMSTTDISADGVGELLGALLADGRVDEVGKLKCWGHSHVNMAVFASGVDEDQTADYLAQHEDFFVRIIANKQGDLYCTAYLIDEDIRLEHIPMEVEPVKGCDFGDWAKTEIAEKVRQRAMTYQYYTDYGLQYDLERFTEEELDALLQAGFIDDEFHDWFLQAIEQSSLGEVRHDHDS